MSEIVSPATPEELHGALIAVSARADWDEVDRIVPLAAEMDADKLINLLSPDIDHPKDDIRDGVMTCWSWLTPKNFKVKKNHFEKARSVMGADSHECAAIWAAVTVARYIDDPDFREMARGSLLKFKERIMQMDVQEKTTDWKAARNSIVESAKGRVPNLENLI